MYLRKNYDIYFMEQRTRQAYTIISDKIPPTPYTTLRAQNVAWSKFNNCFSTLLRGGNGLEIQNYLNISCSYNFCHWLYILNMSAFWIYRGSEKTMVLNMLPVLTKSGFWIYHGSKYVSVTHGAEYARIFFWVIPEYASLCLNMFKSVLIAIVLHLPIVIPC